METEIIKFRNTGSKKAEMKEQSIVYKSIIITFLERLKIEATALFLPTSYNTSKVACERNQKKDEKGEKVLGRGRVF